VRLRKILILSAAGVAFASAGARWTDFVPKPFENAPRRRVRLEKATTQRCDGSGGTTFLREEVVFSRGYFYHPRFSWLISLTGALKQEATTRHAPNLDG
jgi:hypothetical protein